jgi:CheY-like chemotaxis protein
VNIDALLTKPVTPSTLHDAVMQALGHEIVRESRISNQGAEMSSNIDKLRGARILLVEDNDLNQELALELLTSNGMIVEVAGDGQQALDILDKETFDGVLMDCQMPVMDGYAATRILRSNERFRNLPVLAMTANAMVGDREKVLDVGMNDHIAKPINVNNMFRTMAKWIVPAKPSTQGGQKQHSDAHIPELDGINTTDGLARTQGNKTLYLKLLRRVKRSQANFVTEVDAAVHDRDWELAVRLAHTLKGIAGTIGATALERTCGALELELNKQVPAQDELSAASSELIRVLTSLAVLDLPEGGASPAGQDGSSADDSMPVAAPDTEKLLTVVNQLMALLEEYDTEAQEFIEVEGPLFAAAGFGSLMSKVSEALEEYDFDAALSELQEVARQIDQKAADR